MGAVYSGARSGIPLVICNVFTDPTQVIALLSALFGTIVGLVGAYFGLTSSSDASQQVQDLSQQAQNVAQQAARMNFGQTDGTSNEATTVPTIYEATRTSTTPAGSVKDPAETSPKGDQTDRNSPSQEDK
jgi:hypothetical protein